MRKIIYFSIWCVVLCVLAACMKREKGRSDAPTISVTIEPLRYFTEMIAGDKFNVVSLVPQGSSPETYDPTPQQLISVEKSDAYFRIGYIGFEQAWMDKLLANAPDLKVFDMSRGIDLIHEGTEEHLEDEDLSETHSHEKGVEPHIWNSTQNALIISRNIYDALCKLDSTNIPYYTHRLDSLTDLIHRTDSQVRELLQDADSAFMIYHPALSYFARDYGLNQIPIEKGGKEPSPAYLKELIQQCHDSGVRVIFVQPEFDKRNARLIADETQTEIVSINPLDYNWQSEMIKTAKALNHE